MSVNSVTGTDLLQTDSGPARKKNETGQKIQVMDHHACKEQAKQQVIWYSTIWQMLAAGLPTAMAGHQLDRMMALGVETVWDIVIIQPDPGLTEECMPRVSAGNTIKVVMYTHCRTRLSNAAKFPGHPSQSFCLGRFRRQ